MSEINTHSSEAEQSLRSRLAFPIGMIAVGVGLVGGSGFATYEGVKHNNVDVGNFGAGAGLISLGVGLAVTGARGVWDAFHPPTDQPDSSGHPAD